MSSPRLHPGVQTGSQWSSGRPQRARSLKGRRLRLHVELLEDRTLLSSANQVLVGQMYQDLLQRPADAGGLANWTAALDQGASPARVALDLAQSAEGRAVQVQSLYQQFLHRGADTAGLAGFTQALAAGQTLEQVAAAFVASPEYYQNRARGSDSGFLNALYEDVLDRPVDPSGATAFGKALASGTTRAQVVGAILSSDERRQELVQNYYQSFLHRAAEAGGLTNWVTVLQQGARDEQVIAGIIGSAEYALQLQQPADTLGGVQRAAGKPATSWKDDVRVATTGTTITLAGTQTIDGVALAVGDRVLVKDQMTASQNGIYVVSPGPWMRADDAKTSDDITPEMAVRVSEGVTNAHAEWFLATQNPIMLGSTSLNFAKLLPWADVRAFGARGDGSTNDLPAITAAINAGAGLVLFPRGTYKITTTSTGGRITLPDNTELWFEEGAAISIDSATTLTCFATIIAGRHLIFAGSGSVSLPLANEIPAEWFGAVGDGAVGQAAANTTAIQRAINCAQFSGNNNASVTFGAGAFCYSDTLNVTGANHGISFVGNLTAALQEGSARPVTVLRWTGGAKPTFNIDVGYVSFFGLAVENIGTATHFAKGTVNADRLKFERVVCASGSTGPSTIPFSTAFLSIPNIEYSSVDYCEFSAAAPILFDVDGMRATGGTTTFSIRNCIISSANIDTTVVRLKDESMEILGIYNNTFNAGNSGYQNTLTVVDTTLIGMTSSTPPVPQTLGNLIFRDNEYDDSTGQAGARMLKLLRTGNLDLENNNIEGNGSNTAMIELTDSVAYVANNAATHVNGPLVMTMDTLSRVFFGPNGINVGNTQGLLNNSTSSAGIVTLTPNPATTNIPIYGNFGDPGGDTTYRFDMPDSQNYTVYYAQPLENPPGYMTRGQHVTVMIRHTNSGPMGTITFAAAEFKLSGPFTSPANGMNRSIGFVFDGTYMVETWRSSADVPN
jgi:hypothetical protein